MKAPIDMVMNGRSIYCFNLLKLWRFVLSISEIVVFLQAYASSDPAKGVLIYDFPDEVDSGLISIAHRSVLFI